jgi:hypothetical protein
MQAAGKSSFSPDTKKIRREDAWFLNVDETTTDSGWDYRNLRSSCIDLVTNITLALLAYYIHYIVRTYITTQELE